MATTTQRGRLDLLPSNDERTLLEIDWRDGSWSAYTQNKAYDNSTPMYVFHNQGERYHLPSNVNGAEFDAWMASAIEPLIERVCAGFDTAWDGSNHIGQFTDDARAAIERIEELLGVDPDQGEFAGPTLGEDAGTWDAGDWLDAVTGQDDDGSIHIQGFLDGGADIIITADTTDDELAAFATIIQADSATRDVLVEGLDGFLAHQRQRAADAS